MATHSRILAWRIPGTEEPGGLPSMGSHRAGHGGSDLAAAAYVSYKVNDRLWPSRTLSAQPCSPAQGPLFREANSDAPSLAGNTGLTSPWVIIT